MFPDLTRDDVFYLETGRLWLRWPRASDAGAIAAFASLPDVARMTAGIPHPYPPGEAERFILKSRIGNAEGSALALVITQKGGGGPAFGLVSATLSAAREVEIGYILSPAQWGKGYATEAVKALIGVVFGLTNASRILANSREVNQASRRVLENCGFAYIDTGLDPLPARGGLHPCERFQLDRKAWASSQWSRQMPSMMHQIHGESDLAALVVAASTQDPGI
ncbi:Protein N-acetyltransferase, RimJ/RimL family [Methylocapsa palsarum]|uniref:Protein N-acetyltransferase, RimJ/RimL family n=2 Tax=Methylocapsa palsarum TaxID=1612308 RepID=A0A1I4BX40_9HYPH|nr:Protein N-acetyltransferase, RimJ/RimL family [Methylocapsa palsarum]